MISVIGGGPVGNYVAYLLAKAKQEVGVFEEHSSIGLPVQCTGLVTSSLNDVVKIRKEFLVNELSKVKMFAPNGKSIEVKFRKKNLVLDRMKFDRYLYNKALDKGVNFYFNHKFKGFLRKKDGFVLNFSNKKKYFSDKLVGADGPLSSVAKNAKIFGKRDFIVGLQARVSLDLEKDVIEFYLGKKGFGWVVPESYRIARVGVVAYGNPNAYFKSFLKKRCGMVKVRDYSSGLIPLYNPKVKTEKKGVYLVGDAATQVKATTFGGIVPGLMCAEELVKSIVSGKSYQKLWKNRVGRDLFLHYLWRKKFDKFSDKKFNELVRMFGQKKLKGVIEKEDRDFPTKFFLKLVLKEPRLFKFV